MDKPTINLIAETRDYDGYLKIDKAIFKETHESKGEVTYSRFKLTRPDAVAIVLYNSDDDTIILVKQHRYPIQGKVTSNIYEIIAGKIDEGEDPSHAAIREVEEEVGYKIQEGNLIYQSSFFASPGYSSEIIHLYAASVANKDKVSDGGGVEGEHENIDIHHVPVENLFNMLTSGEIVDAKSIIGAHALWHIRNDGRVEIGLKYFEEFRLERAKKIADEVIGDQELSDEEGNK
jgi:ADP-ribose pyrophosphatase